MYLFVIDVYSGENRQRLLAQETIYATDEYSALDKWRSLNTRSPLVINAYTYDVAVTKVKK